MKIYFAHSSAFDFRKELYDPLRASALNKAHKIILPHEESDVPGNTRALIKTLDVFFAEVSYPSTGLGIEIGWAADTFLPIVCVYKKGSKPSSSLRAVTEFFIEYETPADLVARVENFLGRLSFE